MLRRIIIVALTLMLALSACVASPTLSPTVVPQDTSLPNITLKSTNTQSPLPTQTQTILPTNTPMVPTKTHQPTNTPVPLERPPAGITFRTDQGLFVTEASGNTKLLFEHRQHEYAYFSPDGSVVLFYDHESQQIIDLETGIQTLIWPSENYNLCPFSWVNRPSPFTLISVVLPEDTDPGYSCNRGSPVLLTVPGEMTIIDPEGTGYSAPDALPDGQIIAYDLQGTPWLYDWQTGAKQFDVFSFGFPALGKVAFSDPTWSPNGTKIAWTYWTTDQSEERTESGIAIFDFETQTSSRLTPYEVVDFEGSRPRIEWNATETHIAVWHHISNAENFVWEMLAIDGSIARTLDGQFEQWNPVDNSFSIVTNIRRGELSVETPDSSVSHPVCCGIYEVSWSPDGKKLLSKDSDDNYWLTDLEVGTVVQIDLPADANVVSWDSN